MIFRLLIVFVAFVSACSKPQAVNEINTDTKMPEPYRASRSRDSVIYIGFIEKFNETNEFYIYLNFNGSSEEWGLVEKLGDSIVFQDQMFSKRTRIPIDKCRKYFDLSGLDKIIVFDSLGNSLATGALRRIEYHENSIESSFVAIFQLSNSEIKNFQYCIGNMNEVLEPIDYQIFKNEKLNVATKKQLGSEPSQYWQVHHIQLPFFKSTLSFATADTTSYVMESSNESINILYQSKWNEVITKAIPINIIVNDRPVLLIDAGRFQTDMSWSLLLVFDGKEYQISRGNRM